MRLNQYGCGSVSSKHWRFLPPCAITWQNYKFSHLFSSAVSFLHECALKYCTLFLPVTLASFSYMTEFLFWSFDEFNISIRQYTCGIRSSSLSSCHGSTTAMLWWWAYQPTCTTVCSQCSTLLHDPSPVYDAPTTSPTHSPVSTGWRSRSIFSLSWRQSSIVHWTARLLATWLQMYAVCLICRPDDVW